MATLSKGAYEKLLSDVSRILKHARAHKTVDNQLVDSYWAIGERIAMAKVLEQAAYGDSVVSTLSADLDVDGRTLRRSIAFFKEYEKPPASGLTWAHYRELLTISGKKERAFYEKLALDEGLSRDRMLMAIESDLYSTKTAPKHTVRLRRPAAPRYLFEAELLRVIDGDTVLLSVDVGFEVTKQQRVRLASVNTFSLDTQKGRAATRFVAEKLSFADRIVIHTRRADLHGRYLAHVFYSTRGLSFEKTFEKGHYLNQQLLDQKLAMVLR